MAITKLSTRGIKDAAVTTAKVADSAVTTGKIGVDVIVAEDVAANAITVSELAANAVTTVKIANGAVTADKIASGAIPSGVNPEQLGSIGDGSITLEFILSVPAFNKSLTILLCPFSAAPKSGDWPSVID